MSRRVLITGGAGFIGSHVADELLAQGYRVRVLDALPPDDPRRAYYRRLFREMAPRVAGLQKADGYWPASLLDRAAAQPETSGTALFVYALGRGISLGLLDRATYQPAAARGCGCASATASCCCAAAWCCAWSAR